MKKLLTLLLTIVCLIASIAYGFADHCEHVHAAEGDCPLCGDPGIADIPTNWTGCWDGEYQNVTYTCYAHVTPYVWTERAYNPYQHNWVELPSSVNPDCTHAGHKDYKCDSCGNTKTNAIPALGHSYKDEISKEATCTEDGLIKHTCARCNYAYEETIEATGHTIELQHKNPTCTEEGYDREACSKCEEIINEIKIDALGHKFGEWKTVKESSFFEDGEQHKECSVCHEIEKEAIKKSGVSIPVAAGSAAGVVVAAAAIVKAVAAKSAAAKVAGKAAKQAGKKVAEKVAEEVAENAFEKPSIEEKTFVTCLKDNELYKSIKSKTFISVTECEYDDLSTAITDNEPDLTLIDISGVKIGKFIKTLDKIFEENEEPAIAILVDEQLLNSQKKKLDKLVEDKKITGYALASDKAVKNFVKLVLPALKPQFKSDETLENIGSIADLLGIPVLSTAISVFISGREIKDTIIDNDGELGIADYSTIISDIASILGHDTAASVVGLIGDLDDLKSVTESKIGGNEVSTAKGAISDIVEVVGDIIDGND